MWRFDGSILLVSIVGKYLCEAEESIGGGWKHGLQARCVVSMFEGSVEVIGGT